MIGFSSHIPGGDKLSSGYRYLFNHGPNANPELTSCVFFHKVCDYVISWSANFFKAKIHC